MINANELRMGILIEKDNVMYKFLSLEQNHASTSKYRMYFVETLDGKLGKYYSAHFNPIPLTPEILEKCGFEWSIYHQAWHKQGFVFDLSERSVGGFFMHKSRLNSEIICPEIQYLHQLQNLYFSLTGEELTFKP